MQSFYKLSFLSLVTFITVMMGCSKHGDTLVAENAVLQAGLITPSRGPAGMVVTLEGVGFSANSSKDSVYFNGLSIPATILSATSSRLTVVVPESGSTGAVTVHVNGVQATGPVFTYGRPLLINSYSPLGGPAGINDTIRGTGFGTDPSLVTVYFNKTISATVLSANDSMIVVTVPSGACFGNIKVVINRQVVVVGPVFNYLSITSLSPSSGFDGTVDTLIGTGFSAFNLNSGRDSVAFNGWAAKVSSVDSTHIVAVVPAGSGSGTVTVTISGNTATGPKFTNNSPAISTAAPLSGPVWSFVQISGIGFDDGSKVYFNGIAATTLYKGNWFYASVPQGATTGRITVVTSGGIMLKGPVFTVTSTGVCTPAGSNSRVSVDGTGINASFYFPEATAVDKSGTVYVAERIGNNLISSPYYIRKIVSDGTVSTLVKLTKSYPFYAMVPDNNGNLYLAGKNNIIKVTSTGSYSVFAGSTSNVTGSTDAQGTNARFNKSYYGGIAIDGSNTLYMADVYNSVIRKISPSGLVSTPYPASFYGANVPYGVAVDASGNLYFTSNGNINGGSNGLFEITTDGVLHNLASFNSNLGYPASITHDSYSGNLYFSNNKGAIYSYTPGLGNAPVLLAGATATNTGFGDGSLSSALFNMNSDYGGAISTDGNGNIWVADYGNSVIRKVILH